MICATPITSSAWLQMGMQSREPVLYPVISSTSGLKWGLCRPRNGTCLVNLTGSIKGSLNTYVVITNQMLKWHLYKGWRYGHRRIYSGTAKLFRREELWNFPSDFRKYMSTCIFIKLSNMSKNVPDICPCRSRAITKTRKQIHISEKKLKSSFRGLTQVKFLRLFIITWGKLLIHWKA